MRKYIVIDICKSCTGQYNLQIVADYTDREEARNDAQQRNEKNTNKYHFYKVYIISIPLLTV